MNDTTRILQFQAENVMRLVCVDITPDGNLVTIAGPNGAGKTCVLDGIAMTLGGAKLIPDMALRRGKKFGRLVVKLDNGLTVTRTFDKSGSKLTVTRDGGTVTKPQKILFDLLGDLSVDPLEFSSMPPAMQLETLKALLGLDFTKEDERAKTLYDERSEVNREVSRLKGVVAKLAEHPNVNLDDAEPSVEEAMKAVSAARDLKRKREDLTEEADDCSSAIATAESELEKLQVVIATNKTLWGVRIAERDLITVPDIEFLEAGVSVVSTAVTQRAEKRLRVTSEEELASATPKSQTLTEAIDQIKEANRDIIAAAECPIDGLGLGDECVMYNDVPFAQLSSAEKLRISLEMALSMNKELKIALIRDGSLLDEDSLRMVAEIAEKRGAQVWLERVGNEPGAVIMEDGRNIGTLAEATA